MISSYWARIQYQLDSLGLRERLSVFVLIIVALLIGWYIFLYTYQENLSIQLEKKNKQAKALLQVFEKETKRIKLALNDAKTQDLLITYKKLKRDIGVINRQMYKHKQKVISERQVAKVIYAVLNDIKGVKLKSFKSENEEIEEKKVQATENEPLAYMGYVSKDYTLIIKGEYFATKAYLARLEKLAWQFYWDSFVYEVKKYPLGSITIKFHTLSTEDE